MIPIDLNLLEIGNLTQGSETEVANLTFLLGRPNPQRFCCVRRLGSLILQVKTSNFLRGTGVETEFAP